VLKGEAWAVCFFLKCQARERGYVERTEVVAVREPEEIPPVREVLVSTREQAAALLSLLQDSRN
jgi:hypothetical protein